MTSLRRTIVFGVTLASSLTLAMSACRERPNAGEGPYADVVARAVPTIERVTGLKFKTPPKLETRSKAQVREFVLSQFNAPAAQHQLVGSEAAYKLLGLIPDTLDLRRLLVDLLEEQVVGFYDPKTNVLYVVDGAPKDMIEVTITHELVHALQDQYVNLDSVQRVEGNNDRQSAAQAVFEGQAVYEQLEAALGNSAIAFNLPGGWERAREIIRNSQSSMPVYASAPLIIQETLLFPYLSGAEFVRNYKQNTHGGVPFGDMPVSTEQILHPSAYFTKRDAPTPISFVPPAGVKPVYDNNLGEFETRVLLYSYLHNQDDATRGAAGWDGDRYVMFDTPAGRGIAWASVWDTREDAADFYSLLQRAATDRAREKPGRSLHVTTDEIDGRPVVLYVDVPAGTRPDLITLSAVRLAK